MNLIKPLLILCFLGLAAWAFRYRARVEMRAGIRLITLVLTGAAITSIIDPGITQDLANAVGVKRGTDLLLYALVVVFAFSTVGMFLRFRELERRVAQVVRAEAIADALSKDGPPGPSGRAGTSP